MGIIQNSQTKEWLDQYGVTQGELEDYIGLADPDCREAKIVCDFAAHAVDTILALERELELYRRHAEHCKL